MSNNPAPTTSSTWTEQRLQMLISGKIEESSTLEYKRAASLDRSDPKKRSEITKDVSAFANSAGGTLIYGIAEGTGPDAHVPVFLDPVERNQYSKEWLEQMISGIQPKIEGIQILSVTIGADPNKVCYVVEIPESVTAHQATDNRYYKRGNFISEAMKDYEIRLLMNRARHPILNLDLMFIHSAGNFGEISILQVRIRNVGPRIARQYMVDLTIPITINGAQCAVKDQKSEFDSEGNWHTTLPIGLNPKPIFPGSERVLRVELERGVRIQPPPPVSKSPIIARLFADEMTPIEKSLSPSQRSESWQ